MANIQWQPIQNTMGDPGNSLRTYMEGLNNAENAVRGIRKNQMQNMQLEGQLLADQEKNARGMLNAYLKQNKAQPAVFNRQALDNQVQDHFFKGGTAADFQSVDYDPNNKDMYEFVQGGFSRAEENITKVMGTMQEQLNADKANDLSFIENTYKDDPEALGMAIQEHNDKYNVLESNLRNTAFESSQREHTNYLNKLGINLGRNIPTHNQLALSSVGSMIPDDAMRGMNQKPVTNVTTGQPTGAMQRIQDKEAYQSEQAGIRDQSIAAIEQAVNNGDLTPEEAQEQIAVANADYESIISEYDTDWTKSVMNGSNGSIYGTDFKYNEDGTIIVNGKQLSSEVSNAITEAAQISGIPVDTQLALYGAESGYNTGAKSKTGATGLGQLTGGAVTDVINNYSDLLTEAGIDPTKPIDRKDARTNAIVSSLYMKLQGDKYLSGNPSIEDRYIAYNIGAGLSFTKGDFAYADNNTPIDKLGFPVNRSEVQNNIDVYKNKDGTYKTKNEVYEGIRQRMGLNKVPDGNDPVAAIESKVGTKQEKVLVEPTRPTQDSSFFGTDIRSSPIRFVAQGRTIANSIPGSPTSLGGEPITNQSKDFFKENLTKAGIEASDSAINGVMEIFQKDPDLSRLGSEQVSMLMSFIPDGMWTQDFDKAGAVKNFKTLLANSKNAEEMYFSYADDAHNLKTTLDEVEKIQTKFDSDSKSAQERIDKYNVELKRQQGRPDRQQSLSNTIRDITEDIQRKKYNHETALDSLQEKAFTYAGSIQEKDKALRAKLQQGISVQAEKDAAAVRRSIEKRSKADKEAQKRIDRIENAGNPLNTWRNSLK